jgi:DNA-binding NarL/FixJ family response regulator
MKIFIVEDSTLLRERLGELVSEIKGVKMVGSANDAQMALDVMSTLKPDVVILDIRLPHGSGIDILQQLKGHPPSPRVIMFTAFPYPQYRQKCLQAGADYFFDKTTEFDHIPPVIEKLRDELLVSQ